jgi:hypothetical protein
MSLFDDDNGQVDSCLRVNRAYKKEFEDDMRDKELKKSEIWCIEHRRIFA